jgi:hypothetical protein
MNLKHRLERTSEAGEVQGLAAHSGRREFLTGATQLESIYRLLGLEKLP